MFGVIGTCSRIVARRSIKSVPLRKSKVPKSKTKKLPIFQYPISEKGNHRVYVWGLAEHGALGMPIPKLKKKKFQYVLKPSRLEFGEYFKVLDIACGYGYTIFAVHSTNNNVVYGSGINTDSQIGFNESDRKCKNDIIVIPRPINLPFKGTSPQVLGLAAGRAHSLILTNEGLFTLGHNGYGQCGRRIINNENYNKSRVVYHVPDIKGNQIVAVTAGQDHSMLLTEAGEVYTFGWGADGQTGLAHYLNEYRPSLVKGDIAGERIVKLACAVDCVLALNDRGEVFGWGNAEYGQLPVKGDKFQINIATEVEVCQGLGRIVDIAAGGSFCMVLNDAGEVFVWGYGILGFGPEVQTVSTPMVIPSTLFGVNSYEPNIKVSKIYCGPSHFAAVTNVGHLFTWGLNKFGCLGLGNIKDQYFPLKVAVGAQVKKVACGVDHTVTLCKPFI